MEKFKIITGKGYDWETFIYLMQDADGCKFGITNNIERRQRQYKIERPSLKLKYCKPLNNRNIARLIEYKMKIRFPIINGLETTNTPLKELIDFIETSNKKLDEAILELPEILQPKDINNGANIKSQNETESKKSYSLEDKRKEHSNAYLKWTKEDDDIDK